MLPTRILLVSVGAAALGALAAVVLVTLREPLSVASVGSADPVTRRGARDGEAGTGVQAVEDAPPEQDPETLRSLSERISSADPAERQAVALEMLRKGPSALAQARALRPRGGAAKDLTARLVFALQAMRARRRATDYPKLPEDIQQELWLLDARTVVPDEALRAERERYWRAAVAARRRRHSEGEAHEGQVALAEMELALVRRELEQLSSADYAVLATEKLPHVEKWLAVLRQRRGVGPAEVQRYVSRLDALRP